MTEVPWWREGVIYQVYVRSFADGNGDGLGDLPGLLSRIDHLSDLGVSAVWLTPIYPSPDADFGYDVADHCAVDTRLGTMSDLDALVAEAHRRGIRVILDLVLNHTSDRHPWFVESRSRRDAPRRDWYIWRDPVRGGKPPNNWGSVFGGRSWTLDEATGQYYLHMFAPQQPDLNWRNPKVREAQMEVVRFWLSRGVDGFRLDVFNVYFKDARLRDNPGRLGLRRFDRQRHLHDRDQPEMLPLLEELRAILDGTPGRYVVGETFLDASERAAGYVGDRALHVAFSFDFTETGLIFPWNPGWLRARIRHREELFTGERWPTTVMSNHDLPRAASRYSRGETDGQARLAMALLLTLRGTPFIYYGEEIGMRDVSLPRRRIMDPPGRKFWPFYKGRDGCRGPMQWDGSAHGGFSRVEPWLPVHRDFVTRNVAAQSADPESMLGFTRSMIRLRKELPALRQGGLVMVDAPRSVLAFLRRAEGQSLLVALNLGRRRAVLPLDAGTAGKGLTQVFPEPRSRTPSSESSVALGPEDIRVFLVGE